MGRRVRYVAMLMAAVAVGGGLTAVPAAAQEVEPQDCVWVQVGDEQNSNIVLPDTAVTYFALPVTPPPGGEVVLRGRFPHSRYMSFNAYDPAGRPTDTLADFRIQPDAGSTNPFVAGNRRDLAMRSYTVRIVADPPPEDGREPNTLYLGSQDQPSAAGLVLYRIYLPDADRDKLGDTRLPEVSWRTADGTEIEQPLACSIGANQPSTGVNELDRNSDGPTLPHWSTAGDPMSWERFFTLPRAYARLASEDLASEMPSNSEGGFFSDLNNAYVYAFTSRDLGEVVVIEGRIPDTVSTYGGNRRFGREQLRYWSLCQAASAPTGATDTVDCVFDEQVPTDAQGRFTIVISTPEDRPANARTECGVAWLAYGARPDGVAIMRNQLPDPDFEQAIHNVTEPGSEAQVLGQYMPRGSYTSTDEFASRGCDAKGAHSD